MKKRGIVWTCLSLAVACSASKGPPGSDEADAERSVTQRGQSLESGISEEVPLAGTGLTLPGVFGETVNISADPTGFLLTWVDKRDGSDLFGRHAAATHVSNSGVQTPLSGLLLSKGTISLDPSGVRSAFNGQYHLVVWKKGKISAAGNDPNGQDMVATEINAVRISPTGAILDAAPIVLSTLPAEDISTIDAVLSDGNGFFVAWSGTNLVTGPHFEQSRTLSFTGSTPVFGTVTSYPFLGQNAAQHAFVFNGQSYAAASVNPANAGFTVGALNHAASSDCSGSGASIEAIALAANGAGEMLVAYSGRVTAAGSACVGGTKAVQIGTDGLQKAPPIVLNSSSTEPTATYFNGKYFVAGFQIDPATNLATAATFNVPPNVACNASTCLGSKGYGVSRLSSTGVALDTPEIPIMTPTRAARQPLVAAGAGEYLVVWNEETVNGAGALLASRVSATGTALDLTPTPICSNCVTLDTGFDGTDFVVLWGVLTGSDRALRATRISPAGLVKDPTGILINQLPNGFDSALACAPTECLIAWRGSTSNGDGTWTATGISATRLAADGSLLDSPPIQVLASAANIAPNMLAYTGDGYFLQYTSVNGASGVLKLDAAGHAASTPAPLPVNTFRLRPCGSNYLSFRWDQVGTSYLPRAALLNSSGAVLNDNVPIGGIPSNDMAVALTASGCALVWPQSNISTSDIYANVLNSDGTGAKLPAIPLATDDFNELSPALAAGNDGKMLAVYAHFIAAPPIGNFRVATRLLDPSAFGQSTPGGGAAGSGGTSSTSGAGGTLTTAGSGGTSSTSGAGGTLTTAGAGGTSSTSGAGGTLTTAGAFTTSGAMNSQDAGSAGLSASGAGGELTTAGAMNGQDAGSAGLEEAGAPSSGGAATAGAPHSPPDPRGGARHGSGHDSDSGCSTSPLRTPEHAALPIAVMLAGLSAWRRSRRKVRVQFGA